MVGATSLAAAQFATTAGSQAAIVSAAALHALLTLPTSLHGLLASPTGLHGLLASPTGLYGLLASPTGLHGLLASPTGIHALFFHWSNRIPAWLVEWTIVLATLLVLLGLVLGYLLGRVSRRILEAAGVPESVEGTPFERTARSLGTSTVSIISRLLSWFVYGVTVLGIIYLLRPTSPQWFWKRLVAFLPQLFIAAFVVIVGFVVADKAQLVVSERLRSVKLPEVSVVPKLVKYSVLFVAFLIALGQIGVETEALLILLAVYSLGFVVVGAVAAKDILSSATAGIYLLLRQPYGIGDEVVIGEREGIVQEMDVLVTRLETDDAEYVVPNRVVFRDGVRRRRR